MRASSGSLCTAAGKYWRLSVLVAAVAVAPLFVGSAALAQGVDPPALRLIKLIPINGTAARPTTKLFSFDISFVDPFPAPGHPQGLYYLADRSNAALDVIDIATETLFGQIGGTGMGQANFKGDTGNTAPRVPTASPPRSPASSPATATAACSRSTAPSTSQKLSAPRVRGGKDASMRWP